MVLGGVGEEVSFLVPLLCMGQDFVCSGLWDQPWSLESGRSWCGLSLVRSPCCLAGLLLALLGTVMQCSHSVMIAVRMF